MSVNSIGKVGRVQQTSIPSIEQERERRRLELNRTESFERGSSGVDLGAFKSTIDPATQASIDELYAGFSAETREQLQAQSEALGEALFGAVSSTGSGLSAAESAGSEVLTAYLAGKGSDDLRDVNQDFMFMALGGMESYLKGFADKVQSNTQVAKDTRTDLTELRDMLSDWPDNEKRTFSWTEVTYDEKGNPTVVKHENEELDKKGAEELQKKLELQLQTTTEMNEMAKFDLQAKYQDYQQAVQTLAGIQKQVYDDAMKIVNNLRA